MKIFISTIVLLFIISCSSTDTFACSCFSSEQSENFKNSSVVFVGKVVSFGNHTEELSEDFFYYPYNAVFKIEKQWKGKKQSEILALVSLDMPEQCGDLDLRLGESFLIYAARRKGRLLILRDCSPNRIVKDAEDTIKRLDEFCSNGADSACVKKLKRFEEAQRKEKEINIDERLEKYREEQKNRLKNDPFWNNNIIFRDIHFMNEVKLSIPKYIRAEGLKLNWDYESTVEVKIEGKEVILFADKKGLICLANLLLNLSQDEVPSGEHIHLSDNAELKNGSNDLMVGKIG